ncbi:uncharacterized protein [Miscanthus floridulus]|uniref:uncharacterized protein n=1 Tax=Miscanthus floridulus TaxID=154761 RepID=UPI0034584FD1
MDHMDNNPLFGLNLSIAPSSRSSSPTSSLDSDAPIHTTAAAPLVAVLQTVNIKSRVPIVLELANPNYDERCYFFNAFLSKFNLGSHIFSPPTVEQRRDLTWSIVDQCIISWLYNSITKDVHDIVRASKATAFHIWQAIHDQFRDNELHHAVYLEAKFWNLIQGDMDIAQYTRRLKQLADALRDVG